MQEFLQAVQYDADRGAYAEPHLEEALFNLSQNDPSLQEQARKELKTYVALYQRQHAGSLPPNMYIIYDYFMLTGDKSWYVPPAGVISTKNVESLERDPRCDSRGERNGSGSPRHGRFGAHRGGEHLFRRHESPGEASGQEDSGTGSSEAQLMVQRLASSGGASPE